jgi:hypothetical protein
MDELEQARAAEMGERDRLQDLRRTLGPEQA